ncbi:MAG: TetR/AcrR family transcriptional regulator C-terminal domain-containing protein [Oscillospiraceae bacterium]|nr:TetR/AcrR family transcriptional regulator C-terminal domain-containing protein [Oscillospiraceae bacterium]
MPERIKSEHKNASRSRYLIKHAYGELLNEKDPKKITVTDIVERANISRGTFYAHYLDVYDLNMAIQNNMLSTLDKAINQIGIENLVADPTAAITAGLKYLEENKPYFSLFVNSSQGNALISRIMVYIKERLYSVVDERFSSHDNERIKLFVMYTLGAYKSVINSWFAGEFSYSAEECANKLMQIYMTSRPPEIIRLEKTQ